MTAKALTDKAARNARPMAHPYKLSAGGGLYLEVMPNGGKYWRMKYRHAGREKRLAIGVYPQISLKRALVERDRARLALYENRDPSGERKVAKLKARTVADDSFKNIAEEWLDVRASGWTTPETAVAEYGQAEQLFSPGTVAAYRVTLSRVVDFSGGFSPAWDVLWREWDCRWKDLWFRQRIEPPTWELADRVLASGAAGLVFPSTQRPGGVNLVLYPDQLTVDDVFEVHDPDGLLPRDRMSWRSPR